MLKPILILHLKNLVKKNTLKVKNDHCRKFSNLSNRKEGFGRKASSFNFHLFFHFHLQLQFKYELFHIFRFFKTLDHTCKLDKLDTENSF